MQIDQFRFVSNVTSSLARYFSFGVCRVFSRHVSQKQTKTSAFVNGPEYYLKYFRFTLRRIETPIELQTETPKLAAISSEQVQTCLLIR